MLSPARTSRKPEELLIRSLSSILEVPSDPSSALSHRGTGGERKPRRASPMAGGAFWAPSTSLWGKARLWYNIGMPDFRIDFLTIEIRCPACARYWHFWLNAGNQKCTCGHTIKVNDVLAAAIAYLKLFLQKP